MKPTIALFKYNPVAETACCNGMIEALNKYYKFIIFSHKTISKVNFNKVSAVAFPGGKGDADIFDTILANKSNIIRQYVNNGGKYLGICMGAYWASKYYFNLLDNVDVVQYIKRPGAEVRRSYNTTLKVKWKNIDTDMFFFDGCTFVGKKFKTIAKYANGDSMAIVQNNVGLIGCHPESRENWYTRKYLKSRWHQGMHHKLLQEFVDTLL